MSLPDITQLDRAVQVLESVGVRLDLDCLRTVASLQEELARAREQLAAAEAETAQARQAYLDLDRKRQWAACDVRDLESRLGVKMREAAA